MSRAEADGRPAPDRAAAVSGTRLAPCGTSALWTLGLLRSELVTTFRRWRTLALLAVLAGVPVLVGIAVKIETERRLTAAGGGGGRARVHLADHQQRPVPGLHRARRDPAVLPADGRRRDRGRRDRRARRTRAPCAICWSPPPAAPGCCSPSTRRRWRSAWSRRWWWRCRRWPSGALLFPLGEVITISGTRIGFADGLVRALLIALVVAASLVGMAALGLFVSTLTNSGIAAMATTVGLLITVQILDQIPQLHAIQPYLFSHYWLSFADLMREPVYWDDLRQEPRPPGAVRGGVRLGGLGALHGEGHHGVTNCRATAPRTGSGRSPVAVPARRRSWRAASAALSCSTSPGLLPLPSRTPPNRMPMYAAELLQRADQRVGDDLLLVRERGDAPQGAPGQRGLEVDAGGAQPARPVVQVALGVGGDGVPVQRGRDHEVGGRRGWRPAAAPGCRRWAGRGRCRGAGPRSRGAGCSVRSIQRCPTSGGSCSAALRARSSVLPSAAAAAEQEEERAGHRALRGRLVAPITCTCSLCMRK